MIYVEIDKFSIGLITFIKKLRNVKILKNEEKRIGLKNSVKYFEITSWCVTGLYKYR